MATVCTAYLKVAKRADLRSSHHKKKKFNYVCWWILTRLTVRDYFPVYTNSESFCFIPETNGMMAKYHFKPASMGRPTWIDTSHKWSHEILYASFFLLPSVNSYLDTKFHQRQISCLIATQKSFLIEINAEYFVLCLTCINNVLCTELSGTDCSVKHFLLHVFNVHPEDLALAH